MLRALLIASFVVAGLFILHSGFRRRLMWSIRVTLAIYAVVFALRLIIWPFFDFSLEVFAVIGGIALICGAIWLAARGLTDRYVASRQRSRPRAKEPAKAWRSLFSKRD